MATQRRKARRHQELVQAGRRVQQTEQKVKSLDDRLREALMEIDRLREINAGYEEQAAKVCAQVEALQKENEDLYHGKKAAAHKHEVELAGQTKLVVQLREKLREKDECIEQLVAELDAAKKRIEQLETEDRRKLRKDLARARRKITELKAQNGERLTEIHRLKRAESAF